MKFPDESYFLLTKAIEFTNDECSECGERVHFPRICN